MPGRDDEADPVGLGDLANTERPGGREVSLRFDQPGGRRRVGAQAVLVDVADPRARRPKIQLVIVLVLVPAVMLLIAAVLVHALA
jgi:hypothetical protein